MPVVKKPKPDPLDAKRMNRRTLGLWLPIAQRTLRKLLGNVDAPRPNQRGLYDRDAVRSYVLEHKGQATEKKKEESAMSEAAQLRMQTLRSKLAREEFEFAKARGELIPMAAVKAGAANFAREVHSMVRQYFELELPFLCKGRTAIEIQALAIERINRIEQRFAAHSTKLEAMLPKK